MAVAKKKKPAAKKTTKRKQQKPVAKSAGGKIGRREREGAERESTGRGQVGGGSGASRASGTSVLSDDRKRKGNAQETRHHN